MGDRDLPFNMPSSVHHRDSYHSPHHHTRSRDGLERGSREFDSYLDKDRDRIRDRWRDREQPEKDRDRLKDKERGATRGDHHDKESRDNNRGGRDRDSSYGGDSRSNNGHSRAGLIGSFTRAKDVFDQSGEGSRGDRDTTTRGSREDHREDRHGGPAAGANGGLEANTIFISCLPESVTEDSIVALLSETAAIKMDKKSGAPMVKLFEDKMGGREAEVVLDDPRSTAGIVNWYNGYDFKGSKIQVSLAHLPPPSPHDRQGDHYPTQFDRDSHRVGYRGGRGRGRHIDRMGISGPPPPGIRRGVSMFGRGFPAPGGYNDIPPGGESFGRNNPNVTPREGDWICSEPTCGNLNFARRTHCNNCNKPRRDLGDVGIRANTGFSQGGFRGPPHVPFMGGGPLLGGGELGRGLSGHGEGLGGWGRGRSSDFDHGPPPHISDRMSDFRPVRDIRDHDVDGVREPFRERERFFGGRPLDRGGPMDRLPLDSGVFGDRVRDREPYREKRVLDGVDYRGRPNTPLRSRWAKEEKERSSSPGRALYRPDRHRDSRRDERRDRRDAPY